MSTAVNSGFSWCLQLNVSCVSAFLLLWAATFCILTLLSCFNLLTTCFHLPLILPRVLLLSLCVSTACELRYVIYNNPNSLVGYSSLIFVFLKGILLPQLQ